MTALQIFLHFLAWAQHYQWVCFAPDSAGNGGHIVYGGNVVDCLRVAGQQAPLHVFPGGDPSAHCVVASSVPVS